MTTLSGVSCKRNGARYRVETAAGSCVAELDHRHIASLHWIIGVSGASSIPPYLGLLDRFCLQWRSSVTYGTTAPVRCYPSTAPPLILRRLSFFGHLCRADTGQDHCRALRACIRGPPKDWRRRTGRPRQTWLRTVEDDLRPLNFGLATARRRAMDRPALTLNSATCWFRVFYVIWQQIL